MKYSLKALLISQGLMVIFSFFQSSSMASQLGSYSGNKDIHENHAGERTNESVLPQNPFELMHILRKASALDDATSPEDAIDQALEGFYDNYSQIEQSVNN
ncbi:hypothetical protein [Prochlorococcus sp. MIT 1223]|uniref:hypothetical protein n=1 Tax=Prochlorococcus sp. MIT 1223 TaxID=3096217 RepID=UPI002A765973|nr:hypothetical protein [Prochlorococcus sp. MIT 1223]